MLKYQENTQTEDIGFVTPTPDQTYAGLSFISRLNSTQY